jgi:archaemetzincin
VRRAILIACLLVGCGSSEPTEPPRSPPKAEKPAKKPATFATEAIGDASKLLPPVQRMLDPEGFEDPGKPQPGEWRYEHREKPQSFDAYIRSKPNVPFPGKNTIYLLPLGEFPPDAPPLEAMQKLTHAYFTLDVKVLPAVPIDQVKAKRRINGGTKKRQLLAPDVLKWLEGQLPADAYALMAVTMEDLYPDETWNFVFGMASFEERVGVQSFARQDPAFFGEKRDTGWQLLAMRRATWTVVHEVAHMFGLHHCQYYKCSIAGSNSQDESDRAPLHACPVCMHKLWWAIEFDPAAREENLAKTLRALGIEDEAAWSEQRARWIRDGKR